MLKHSFVDEYTEFTHNVLSINENGLLALRSIYK